MTSLRKQYESAEASQRSLESTISELRDELEAVTRQREEVVREKDRLTEDLDAISAEKNTLEKTRQSLKTQVCVFKSAFKSELDILTVVPKFMDPESTCTVICWNLRQ